MLIEINIESLREISVGVIGWPVSPAHLREMGRWKALLTSEGLVPKLVLSAERWTGQMRRDAEAFILEPVFVEGLSLDVPYEVLSTFAYFPQIQVVAVGPAIESTWERLRVQLVNARVIQN